MSISRFLSCIAFGTVAFFAQPVAAQPATLPGSADPSRVFTESEIPAPPPGGVDAVVMPSSTFSPPPGSDQIYLTLQAIDLEGAGPESRTEAEALYRPYLGQRISLETLYKIAHDLQQTYWSRGYILTRVILPPQDIEDGRVTMAVIETPVVKVIADGLDVKQPLIRDAVKRINGMGSLNVRQLERTLLLLNDLTGQHIISLINPTPGQTGVTVVMKREAGPLVSGQLSFNNYSSVFSGPVQLDGDISTHIAGLNYMQAQLAATTTLGNDELRSGRGVVTLPVFGISGTTVWLEHQLGYSHPGDSLREFDIDGITRITTVGARYPIYRQRDGIWSVYGQFSSKDSVSKLQGSRLYEDSLRVIEAGTTVNYADSLFGINNARLAVSQGIDAFGARESGSLDLSRELGRSDFTKFQGDFYRLQSLPGNFSLLGGVTAQYTNDVLLSGEEFGFGGASLGRGYDPSELTGESGVGGKIELRYSKPMEAYTLQPYTFFDIGQVWNKDTDGDKTTSAASTGLGLRIDTDMGLSLDGTLAMPLTKSADNPPPHTDGRDSVRALFNATMRF
ncbi:MAG: ShlB/FhaC/HecB family hemolysin secretion/activation protein [Pseudomonadota bacterium]